MAYQSDGFHAHAAERLFLAVVNQAISDVLENNEEAKAAEQWLLSQEFDNYAELLCWDGEVDRRVNSGPSREFAS